MEIHSHEPKNANGLTFYQKMQVHCDILGEMLVLNRSAFHLDLQAVHMALFVRHSRSKNEPLILCEMVLSSPQFVDVHRFS